MLLHEDCSALGLRFGRIAPAAPPAPPPPRGAASEENVMPARTPPDTRGAAAAPAASSRSSAAHARDAAARAMRVDAQPTFRRPKSAAWRR
jgi:hypothetical protein